MNFENILDRLKLRDLIRDRRAMGVLVGFVLLVIVISVFFSGPSNESNLFVNQEVNLKDRESAVLPRVERPDLDAGQKTEYQPNAYETRFSTSNYEIEYEVITNKYNIYLIGGEYPANRVEAEAKFLEIYGLSRDDACQLDVEVFVPIWMESRSRPNPKLSFCF